MDLRVAIAAFYKLASTLKEEQLLELKNPAEFSDLAKLAGETGNDAQLTEAAQALVDRLRNQPWTWGILRTVPRLELAYWDVCACLGFGPRAEIDPVSDDVAARAEAAAQRAEAAASQANSSASSASSSASNASSSAQQAAGAASEAANHAAAAAVSASTKATGVSPSA